VPRAVLFLLLFDEESPKICFRNPRKPYEKKNEQADRRQVYYATAPICRTKILAIFEVIFKMFRDISGILIIYSELSRRTTDDILRKPVWEVLLER